MTAEPRVERSPEPSADRAQSYRVVIDSIGTADVRVIAALRQVLHMGESQLAAVLYQAPSELIRGLPQELAVEISSALNSVGIESRAVDSRAAFTCGDSLHELAIHVREPKKLPQALELVMQVVGASRALAQKLLFQSPCLLLGRLSEETARCIAERFRALDIEVDISRQDQALYDVFVAGMPAAERYRMEQALEAQGLAVCKDREQPLLCTGLTKAQAESLWERGRHAPGQLAVLCRDFQRFDLRLEQAPDSEALKDYLIRKVGMPRPVAEKVPKRTPIVLFQSIPYAAMQAHAQALVALGAKVSVQLLAFARFTLRLVSLGDAQASIEILERLCGVTREEAQRVLRPGSELPQRLTQTQARWAQWELRQAGAECTITML